jgi:uncharacterized protein (TIGR02391 family)
MPSIPEAFPDAKTLVALTPEDLGASVLELVHKGISQNPGRFQLGDFLFVLNSRDTAQWPQTMRDQVRQALAEAFSWLENVGLIMEDPSQNSPTKWRVLTRRANELRTRQAIYDYRDAAMLPSGLIHPEILDKSQAAFMRGDHDIAVLAAFKAVEVAARQACRYQNGEIGVPLMRRAFNRDNGPLTDMTQEAGERQALQDLFAGAIGAAKNPASHRDVEMSKIDAARLILFASYLMSIVEERAK